MNEHSIAEMTSGLASRVNNLAVATSGPDSRILMEQQDELAKLAMAAIVQDLDSIQAKYADAVKALTDATAKANTAIANIGKVQQAISTIATAIAKVTAALA